MGKKYVSIAIDGPSGAGKSTLAKLCAKEFGFVYVDTGAIYRTLGLYVIRSGADSKDESAVTKLLGSANIGVKYDSGGEQRMVLNGEDVTDFIRTPEVSICASNISSVPAVRAFLLDMQRGIAERNNVIMDGRDIGTVVLPDADLKIFLTADLGDRANRRYLELLEKGVDTDPDSVLSDMEYRDKNDASREASPLKVAEGAVIVDTTGDTPEESAQTMFSLIREKLSI